MIAGDLVSGTYFGTPLQYTLYRIMKVFILFLFLTLPFSHTAQENEN